MRWFIPALISISMAVASSTAAQERDEDPSGEPLDIGQVEQVEIQLVLLDVLALDRRDRTVPGLRPEQFRLRVDTKTVEISSLDVHCPLGVAKDPKAGQAVEIPEPPPGTPPRKIVHAFDYYHMGGHAAWTLEIAEDAIKRLANPGEEHMIVTIGTGLRIQSPFTSEVNETEATLRRMYEDPRLYAGFYGRLTERPFYRRLVSLIDFLELIDGPKIVVLYSGPFRSDGFNHDPEFKLISAMAAKARVAIYPVDAGGLRTPRGFRYGDLGGPKTLARLAVETGGRVTYHTNDLGLAIARAQRDSGCRYTLGFYDTEPKLDEARRVSISVKQDGVRAVHPIHYVLRSETKQLASQSRTAGVVPEMYDDGGMVAEAVSLRPHSSGRWDVLVAVRLPEAVSIPGSGPAWKVESRVMTLSGAVVRRFERELPTARDPADDEVRDPRPTLVESLTLKPGAYRVSVVLSRGGMSMPWATHDDFELPTIPSDELFLVGPHLGRKLPDGEHAIESVAGQAGEGPTWKFEPLIAGSARRGDTVEALTWVCRVGDAPASRNATVERELIGSAGETVGRFDPVDVVLDEPERVSCHALLDALPTSELKPDRYSLRAFLQDAQPGCEVALELNP